MLGLKSEQGVESASLVQKMFRSLFFTCHCLAQRRWQMHLKLEHTLLPRKWTALSWSTIEGMLTHYFWCW